MNSQGEQTLENRKTNLKRIPKMEKKQINEEYYDGFNIRSKDHRSNKLRAIKSLKVLNADYLKLTSANQ